nr:Os03g0195475 [Ipomoea batatas]GME04816.1 Os03g0195475 [Ipomoea batatas]
MTDKRGASAGNQNIFLFLLPMNLVIRMKIRNALPIRKLKGDHCSWNELKTALKTDTTSVLVVKWLIPNSPLSCWRPITMAAPPMNPTMAACERKSTRNPNLQPPNTLGKIPAKKVTVKTMFL